MDEAVRHCAAMMEAMHGMHGAADGDWGAGGMMGMGGMGEMGGMLAFGLLWLVIIAALAALLIFGGIWLWRRGQPASTGAPAPSARETLNRRYAAGELDRETYLQVRSDLEVSS
ncbi:MAG: hypothetical protein ABJC24_00450 [Chloroflexota bacterium]